MYSHEAMIRFTYRLGGAGWATATIANKQKEMTVPASYLCDALRDFVDAVQSLFVTAIAECAWEEEPGEVRWLFRRNENSVHVQVDWHDQRETFTGDDDLLHFSAEVQRELDNLIATWGEEGYLKQWGYPFPHKAYRKLEQAMRSERERRKAAMRQRHLE
jgi:hypothetical protein